MRYFFSVLVTLYCASFWCFSALAVSGTALSACQEADHYYDPVSTYEKCSAALVVPTLAATDKVKVLLQRGEALYFAQQNQLAKIDIDAALSLEPHNKRGLVRRFWIAMMGGSLPQAFDTASTIAELFPDDPESLFLFYFYYADTPERESHAIPALKRALSLKPDYLLARMNWATHLLKDINQPEAALKEYDAILAAPTEALRAVHIYPSPIVYGVTFESAIRYRRFSLLMFVMSTDVSVAELDQFVKDFPGASGSWYLRAEYHLRKDNPQRALDDARHALKLERFFVEASAVELGALYRLHRDEEGLRNAESLLKDTPPTRENAVLFYWRGAFHKVAGHTEEAMDDFRTAASLNQVMSKVVLTQLIQHHYYVGEVSDPFSAVADNALRACVVDPACTGRP